jgi:hypothetical protein
MANAEDPLVKSLQAIASEALGMGDEHPEPEELLAYGASELPEDRASRIGAHLGICPDCAQVVLDLAAFPEVELRAEGLGRTLEEERADWQAIQEQIQTDIPLSTSRRRPSLTWVHALAAVLALIVLGLSFWVAHLELRMRTASNLQANLYIRDLLPGSGGGSRNKAPENMISVPAGLDYAVLVLALADFEPFPDYQIKIFDSAGALRWSRAGMVRLPDGSFTLEVRKELLPSGPYQIQLYGVKARQQKLLATYSLQIVFPEP